MLDTDYCFVTELPSALATPQNKLLKPRFPKGFTYLC